MEVRKSDGSIEEYSASKVMHGICEAYKDIDENCPEGLIESLVDNLFIYDKITTREIRRQVEEALMSVNKKVAREYISKCEERNDNDKALKRDSDFIRNYINASNASTGSKYDSNANVEKKNIVTLGQELHKGKNIQQNRYIMHNKIKSLYTKKLADQYLQDLENHVLYKHDESGTPGYPYTYSSKEVVEVKYGGRHLLLPFDLLWEVVKCDEVMVDSENIVWQKYPKDLFVRERDNGYVKITALTKKKRHRDLVRVKTAFGEDIVVTDNHPLIINKENINDTVEAIDGAGHIQFKTDDILEFGNKDYIDVSECPDVNEFSSNYCLSYTNQAYKRYVKVDWNLGYLVGFFVGDGNYNHGNGRIIFTQKERDTLVHLNEILFESLGVAGTIRYKKDISRCYILGSSCPALWWLLSEVFRIQDKAENKTLPYDLLEYGEEFSKGLLCGLIDSDGSVNGAQLSIRVSSRACVLQATALLRYFGYGVGNTVQSLPFGNNEKHFHTNYTIWGVNCSARPSSKNLGDSYKLNKITESAKDERLKYKKCGETSITSVTKISEDDTFLDLNDYIYDITTESRCFSLNNILVHNCVAITMYPFLVDGLTGLGGQSCAPTDLKSFCGEFINLVYSVSSQFMGAVATPEVWMYMDYFIRKDYGEDYLDRLDEIVDLSVKKRTLEQVIENCFQQIVHSMNMPAGNRGYQTVFWNVGYFDKNYFEGVFGDFKFPDGTVPKWETLSWLQKKFMKWFNKEREKYILTFPVETMAMLTDGHDVIDKEYANFTAEMWAEGHSFFCYLSDSPDSLSSCCRLRNSLKDGEDEEHNHTTHQST